MTDINQRQPGEDEFAFEKSGSTTTTANPSGGAVMLRPPITESSARSVGHWPTGA